MNCPYCSRIIQFKADSTHPYWEDDSDYPFELGVCPNPECAQVIVLLHRGKIHEAAGVRLRMQEGSTTEILYPRIPVRGVPPDKVPDGYKRDFVEAALVLNVSPKASAAISRRLLQHVLREHYGIQHRTLAAEIDEFVQRTDTPSFLTEAVDAVRTVGNIAAHPMKDEHTGSVVDVEPGEAEWLLEVLESLFDVAFVQPAKLERRKVALNEKLESLGKPPLRE